MRKALNGDCPCSAGFLFLSSAMNLYNTGVLCDQRVVFVADFVDHIGFRALGFRNKLGHSGKNRNESSFKSSETRSCFTDYVAVFAFSLSSTDFRL